MLEGNDASASPILSRREYLRKHWFIIILSCVIFTISITAIIQYLQRQHSCRDLIDRYTLLVDRHQTALHILSTTGHAITFTQQINSQLSQQLVTIQSLLIEQLSKQNTPERQTDINRLSTQATALAQRLAQEKNKVDVILNEFNKVLNHLISSNSAIGEVWSDLHERCGLQAPRPIFSMSMLQIAPAEAAVRIGSYSEEDIRGVVVVGVFGLLAIYYVGSLVMLFIVVDTRRRTFAIESIKHLTALFTGLLLSLLGLK